MRWRGWPVLAAGVAGVVLAGAVTAGATTSTVTTKSGVVTHGSIRTTKDTIGWLLDCQPSHTLPDDPIVHPGAPGAAHLHDFWGNASTTGNSTVTTQEAPGNVAQADTYNGSATKPGTSCDLGQYAPGTSGDTASYWAPSLYADGSRVIPGTKAELYYRAKPTYGTGFVPYPQDARIIVGNHMAMSAADNPALAAGHLYWECDGSSATHYQTPPTSCSSLLLNVVFPDCWDGQPMGHTGPDGTDDNHFAYAGATGGACPAAYARKVPQLSEKFKYTVPAKGMLLQLSADRGGPLLPTYTAHADFWNTWQPAALQYLVDRCLNAGVSCGTNPIIPTG